MKKDKGIGVTMIVGLPKPGKKGPCPMCGDKKCDGSCMDDEEMEELELEDEEEMDDFAEEDAEDEDMEIALEDEEEMEDEMDGGLEALGVEAEALITAVKEEDPIAFESSLKSLFTKWYKEMES